MDYTILAWILIMTILNGLMAFGGIFSFFIKKNTMQNILLVLVSLATGALIGGAFFHLIPESLEGMGLSLSLILIVIGFIGFYLLEKFLHWHHCHDKECKHSFTYLILYGDAMHNFIDGLLIAGSFLVSIKLGIITSLMIIAHELPQEIGNFGVLVYGGFKRKKALLYSFLAQLTSVIGGILGFFFFSLQEYAIYLLPFAAGGFLYIAIMDLIPEIYKEKNKMRMLINIGAIIFGILILLSAKYLTGE